MENKKEYDDLLIDRARIKAAVSRALSIYTKYQWTENNLEELKLRRDKLAKQGDLFDDIQQKIEHSTFSITTDIDKEREGFEEKYFATLGEHNKAIKDLESSHNTKISQNSSIPVANHPSRLPTIPLPHFSGNYQQWKPFIDQFNALVTNDTSLSDVQKIHYLKSCLSDQALDVVSTLASTDSSFNSALDLLRQRYDHKRRTIQSHIRAILDLPKISTSSATTLSTLLGETQKHIQSLKNLGQSVEKWDTLIIEIVLRKLDKITLQQWELSLQTTDVVPFSTLETFLDARIRSLEAFEGSQRTNVEQPRTTKNTFSKQGSYFVAQDNSNVLCPVCSHSHAIYRCFKFKNMKIPERNATVRKLHLCFNCLSAGHSVDKCSAGKCRSCDKKHNTLLHDIERKNPRTEQQGKEKRPIERENMHEHSLNQEESTSSLCAHIRHNSHVLLGTAVVNIENHLGQLVKTRAVLDSGSQINLISNRLATKLNIPRQKGTMPVSGIGSSSVNISSWIWGKVHSRQSTYSKQTDMFVINAITHQLPVAHIDVSTWALPDHVFNQLADPRYHQPAEIDLLLGAELFFDLLGNEQVKLNNGSITAYNTKLGWVLSGKVQYVQRTQSSMCLLTSIHTTTPLDEAKETENHFCSTYIRNESGRFILKLPFKDNYNLGSSYDMARRRFFSLEKRMSQNEDLKRQYIEFLNEYEAIGHMTRIENPSKIHTECYYMPHHAVLRSSSLTTKLRVVFDASAKSSNGTSLNDMLMNGGVVQDDLVSIVLRFRLHEYVMTADVEKMYRQILIDLAYRDYQRILWRDSPEKELSHYQLNTVTYGTASAPYQATRCLQELSTLNSVNHPRAAEAIRKDFYVDDLLTGADSIDECIQLQNDISLILSSAGMNLRKWCSNTARLVANMTNTNSNEHVMLDLEDNDTTKTLGLVWNPRKDPLLFQVSPHSNEHPYTKRTLLADLNRVFDPLGLLSPILIRGKMFIQELWQLKLDWDTLLPNEMCQRWRKYTHELSNLDDLRVVRKVKSAPVGVFELHGFCDASIGAYGACVYIRQKQPDNSYKCHLLTAKNRVAPLKTVSIPRLELCSALVLAILMEKVTKATNVDLERCTCWTDSAVALAWIRGVSSQWATFVSNRVSEIQTLTEGMTWRHVRTKSNPADLVSRGMTTTDLKESTFWWNGPTFLKQHDFQWPTELSITPAADQLEWRPTRFTLLVKRNDNSLLNQYSRWTKLLRVTAFIRRFIHNTRIAKNQRQNCSRLSVLEIREAKRTWIRMAQEEEFQCELKSLRQNTSLSKRSKLITLSPFLDEGIIRVGGRLQHSHLPNNQRHPAILPKGHKVTELKFNEYHQRFLHAGPQNLLARMRQEFWPLDARNTARRIVHNCETCYRAKPKTFQPVMGRLPQLRVTQTRPFAAVGVDFAGPIYLHSGPRNRTVTKAYIAVFICFSTKAVHLEAIGSLSAQSFLAALRRFFSRRGHSAHIYSDNGTNFIGARSELRRYYQERCNTNKTVPETLAAEEIQWHFNPPSAPHMGGIWEAAVKSTKHHLTRIVKSAKLNMEEMSTLLCQIEACLNSRPLTPQSSDPESFAVLTPAHFLVGGCLTLPPEVQHPGKPTNLLKKWQLVQGMMQVFWRRWSSEYLHTLQTRARWNISKGVSVRQGDLVLIREDNQPPLNWHVGRVVKVHPGPDNEIRVVTIKTHGGKTMQRPVVKLCPLPYMDKEDSMQLSHVGENVAA